MGRGKLSYSYHVRLILRHIPVTCDFIITCLVYYPRLHCSPFCHVSLLQSTLLLPSHLKLFLLPTLSVWDLQVLPIAYSFRSGPHAVFMYILYLVPLSYPGSAPVCPKFSPDLAPFCLLYIFCVFLLLWLYFFCPSRMFHLSFCQSKSTPDLKS